MKNLSATIAILLCSFCSLHAQNVNDLFQQKTRLVNDFHSVATKYQAFDLNTSRLATLSSQSTSTLKMDLPFENSTLKLDLKKAAITTPNFSVVEALPGGGRRTVSYSGGTFYQGKIEGKENSFATIAVFKDQVMGVIADEQSNIVLGAIERNGKATNEYTLYRDKDLTIDNPFVCSTPDGPAEENNTPNPIATTNAVTEAVGAPIEIYFECDFKFYQDKGSNTTTVINYVLSFFNNTALLYDNEDIKVQVSQILVWTTQDPEAAAGLNTTSAVLPAFRTRMQSTTFVGDYAHFLSTRSLGGGIAYLLSNPCGSSSRVAVSAINNTYQNFPTYSWTVMVVTHELGHNFGSNHTQWCGWVGGALDNCFATEGGCPPGPAPTNGGTIMSYCHTTSTGINLNNGFGQQPGDKIRQVIGAATCFGSCSMTITSLTKIDASCGENNGSATVTTANSTGAVSYLWSNGQTGATLSNVGPGTYHVTVSDAAGCRVMDVVTIVNSGATLNAVLTPGTATSFCTGSNVLLSVTNNAAYTYQWYRNNIIISGAISNTYTATTGGNYSVVVTSGSCSVTRTVVLTEVPVPSAAINPASSTTFCAGGSVVLNGSPSGSYTYQWYNNASPISGATNPTYTATTSGNYTVKVSAGTCESTSTSTTVTVNPTPIATATAGGATSFCTGGSVTLNATTGSGYTYEWYNGASIIGGATNSTYTATASGNYTVRVTANGCQATSAAIVVSVVATPTANITPGGATTFCAGGTVVLNANAGGSYSYQWYNNASPISGATNPTYSATASGNYTVKVFAGNCEATSTPVVVTVNPVPQATVSVNGATTFCSGGSVVLNAGTGSGYTYQWYNGGTLIGGATNASYTALTSGSYSVRVTANGCEATSSATIITVNPTPVAAITAGGPVAFCSGGNVVLSATTGNGYTYQWYNNAVAIGGAVNATYTATTSGNYTVRVTANTCEVTSSATTVTVSPAPQAVITANGSTSFCNGGNVTINANTGTGYIYQWYRNGVAINAATNSSYQATTSGNYTATITLGTCVSTSSATAVTVFSNPVVTVTPASATIQKFQTQLLTATGAASYNWAAQSALVSSTASSAVVRPLTTTTYTIEGTDNNGCKGTTNATVTVIGCGDVTGITTTAYSPSRVLVKWTNPQGVTTDTLQYRKTGSTTWTKIFVTGQEYELSGLQPGVSYEYNVIPLCNTTTVFLPSAINTFSTAQLSNNVYIKLFPNPAINSATRLEVIVDVPFTMQAIVYDNKGKMMMTISPSQNYPAGQVIKQVNPERLANGLYHIAITINGKMHTIKMLVNH
ncbi:hypothetical protein CAP36_06745 [Chitinophagaceae bacterium IBVUCB2]|nr:hypothetical protein CAP36_06745 [Chitinophagaceae bacterium IBVUCB2]